ncbi:MAG: ferritin-like domain-containing protein [Chloroflexota bacterium]|nr:ferritin-like domain-containing protein [Chloroflexota bacterium]
MDSPQEFFVHEMQDLLGAEQLILKTLPKLIESAGDKEVKAALKEHEKETKQQIKNLEECFKLLGEKAEAVPCKGMQGIVAERDEFLKEKPSPEILQVFDLGAAAKAEHYEIVSYSGLVDMAKLMGQKDIAKLLQENLKQEQAMAKTVEGFETQLGKQLLAPMIEQIESESTAQGD